MMDSIHGETQFSSKFAQQQQEAIVTMEGGRRSNYPQNSTSDKDLTVTDIFQTPMSSLQEGMLCSDPVFIIKSNVVWIR